MPILPLTPLVSAVVPTRFCVASHKTSGRHLAAAAAGAPTAYTHTHTHAIHNIMFAQSICCNDFDVCICAHMHDVVMYKRTYSLTRHIRAHTHTHWALFDANKLRFISFHPHTPGHTTANPPQHPRTQGGARLVVWHVDYDRPTTEAELFHSDATLARMRSFPVLLRSLSPPNPPGVIQTYAHVSVTANSCCALKSYATINAMPLDN